MISFCLTGGAAAQSSAIAPTFFASTSYSDTRGRNDAEADRQFITQVAPGLNWSSRSGRIQGSANYAMVATFYSDQDEANDIRNALSAQLKAEAVEDWLFVDAQGSIAQQAISPFGRQTQVSSGLANDNQTEVRTFSVSPHVRGSLLGWADYEVRWTGTSTDGGTVPDADSRSRTTRVTLSSPSSGAMLGWNLSATRQSSSFDSGVDSQTDRLQAGITAAVRDDLRLGLTAGQESTDVIGGTRISYDNWGWNLLWTPTPRTNLSFSRERRYFGNSHTASFSHRMRRSSWVYTDTRGATSGSDPFGTGRPVTLFALYFELFAAQEPDPARREALVLDFLRAIGQDPGALVAGGILNTAVTLQRRQDLGLALQGIRTTLNLRAYSSETRALQDTNAQSLERPIRQKGFTASLSHRLAPTASLTLTGSLQQTESNGIEPANDLRTLAISYSKQVSQRISGSISLRHTVFDSDTNPYRESAATASLSLQF